MVDDLMWSTASASGIGRKQESTGLWRRQAEPKQRLNVLLAQYVNSSHFSQNKVQNNQQYIYDAKAHWANYQKSEYTLI